MDETPEIPIATATDDGDWLRPCPFSPGFRLPVSTAWQSLVVYQFYRMALAGILLGLFRVKLEGSLGGNYDPTLFEQTATTYFMLVLAGGLLLLPPRRLSYAAMAKLKLFIDIAAITVLAHAAGGPMSGLAMLLAVTVAASGLLVGGRCSAVFAAIAAMGVLGEQLYSHAIHGRESAAYTYAGAQGAAFFAIALLAHVAARRTETSQALAQQRAADLDNLRELNSHIVQQLQHGIVVVDEQERIVTANRSALVLLDMNALQTMPLDTAAPSLADLYHDWQRQPWEDPTLLQTADGRRIQVRFSRFAGPTKSYSMVFLEDDNSYSQRVQRSKLASLGRLTASIAHEIRNPLSSVRHAAQLLAENPALEAQDRRLTQIVLDNSARLEEVVRNVLQLSARRPVGLVELELGAWMEQFLVNYESAHFDYTPPAAPCPALADPGQLRQILENLCTNAIKYGAPENGPVRVKIAPYPERGLACIEVADSGPGIPPDVAEQIFEPFFTTSPTGSGLGLYIARELAELNRARLTYEPPATGGACFHLYLSTAPIPISSHE